MEYCAPIKSKHHTYIYGIILLNENREEYL